MIHKYRIKANDVKIYIQKQYRLFDIPLWWDNLDKDGDYLDCGAYSSGIHYYKNIQEAKDYIKKFCKSDHQNDTWNKSCETVQEITCKDIKKG